MNIKKWILENLFTPKGINARKSTYTFLEFYPESKNEILKLTNFLSGDCRISERIYCIMNDIDNLITCKYEKCNNKVFYISYNQGYKSFCSANCSSKSSIIKAKIIESNKRKFGVEWFAKTKEFKEKIKKTCIEKYGTENALQSKEIQEKIKQTNLKKYGVENLFQSEIIKEKIKQTNLQKYGVENVSQKNVNIKILKLLNNKKWLKNEHLNLKKSLNEISLDLNVCSSTIINYCRKHKIKVQNYFCSFPEKQIIEHIDIDNIEINVRSIISPYELDINIPDYKLAIEFNGLFWHSRYDKCYHLNKTKLCEQKQIQLLHIFENEWIDPIKQNIWKSIINNKLGRNNKIYARKCEIKEIKNIKHFLNNNHLQGYCGSSISLGLFYEDELVSVMTFGKTRFNKKYEYEMIRFCNKNNLSIIGSASKLFKYFIRNYNPSSVITYADRRYSNGNLYNKLGFQFTNYSKPSYWYFKIPEMKLYSRLKFQKHKLSDLLENYDSNKSEIENMLNNGYYRIFDCGNLVYVWNN